MIAAGRLNQRITLEAPASASDALGQTATRWETQATIWAEARETPGREFLKGDYRAEEKVAFVIRWRAIDSTWRVTWRGRTYRIVSVTGTRPSGECWLHTVATEGAN